MLKKKKKSNHETMKNLGNTNEGESFLAWEELGQLQLGFAA